MELLHLFLEAPQWEQSAMERAKQMWLSHYRALGKGLERATADRIMTSMLGPDRWVWLSGVLWTHRAFPAAANLLPPACEQGLTIIAAHADHATALYNYEVLVHGKCHTDALLSAFSSWSTCISAQGIALSSSHTHPRHIAAVALLAPLHGTGGSGIQTLRRLRR